LRGGARLSPEAAELIDALFEQLDSDGSAEITQEEAQKFFGDGFGKMSVKAMFSEVDVDADDAISVDEFRSFWERVRASGYSDQDIIEELHSLLAGHHWVDFDHQDHQRKVVLRGNTLSAKSLRSPSPGRKHWSLPPLTSFTKRLSRDLLSPDVCALLKELFDKIDKDGSGEVSRQEAGQFFRGGFGKMSAQAMFNEVDMDANDVISFDEFKSFWDQVKRTGYPEADIIEEIRQLLDGCAWADFKDERQVTRRCATLSAKQMLQAQAVADTISAPAEDRVDEIAECSRGCGRVRFI